MVVELTYSAAAWGHVVVDRAHSADRPAGTTRWIAEDALRLTKGEADELVEEVDAVAGRWAERTRGREGERRTYLLHSILQPYPAGVTAPRPGTTRTELGCARR